MPDFTNLNEIQLQAVTWGKGPLLLLAGPGSGKTTVIVNRISYLLSQGVRPESILVITFTKDAALSMQQRFQKISNQTSAVNFGTFHAVFYHIFKESTPEIKWNLVSHYQKSKILISVIRELLPDYSNSISTELIDRLLEIISLYKNTGQLQNSVSKLEEPLKAYFLRIFERYRTSMRKNRNLDFDDMLYECRELLKNDLVIRHKMQQKYQYILVDEFQDINPMQYEILKLLAPRGSNLFAVGDDDQSIYSFRGASPNIMQNFKEHYTAFVLQLTINYRSVPAIVECSAEMIQHNKQRFQKKLFSKTTANESAVKIWKYKDKKEQQEILFKQLELFIKRHREDGKKAAVLFRTNLYLQTTAARLSARGIPFDVKDGQNDLYEHFIVKDIIAYLELAYGAWNKYDLIRILNRPVRYVEREALVQAESINDIIEYYRNDKEYHRKYTDVVSSLHKLKKQLTELCHYNLAVGIVFILNGIGYGRYVKALAGGDAKKSEEWECIINWLKEDAAKYSCLEEWKEAQNIYREQLTRNNKTKKESRETLQLMTVHGSKGLEFDTVFIPDCLEKMYPHGNSLTEDEVEEERRIFYVAVTRAKEELILSYPEGTKARPGIPSRFLAEMKRKESN